MKTQKRSLITSFTFLLTLTIIFTQATYGIVREVGSGKTYSTIQAAVDAAISNDTIKIFPGTYAERVTLNGTKDYITIVAASDEVCINGGISLSGSSGDLCENNIIEGLQIQPTTTTGCYSYYARNNTWKNCVVSGSNTLAAFGGNCMYGADTINHCTIYDCNRPGNYGYASSAVINNSIIAFCAAGWSSSNTSSSRYSNWYDNPSPDAGWTGVTTTSCINSDPLFRSVQDSNSDFLGLLAASPCISTAEDGNNMGASVMLEVGAGKTYSTIQAAVNAAVSHDTIKIFPGIYAENVTIGATQDSMKIVAAGREILIQGSISLSGSSGDLCENNIIEGLQIQPTTTTGCYSYYARNNTWKNCVVSGSNTLAAFGGNCMYGADTINHCTIYDCNHPGNYGYASSAVINNSIIAFCATGWSSLNTSSSQYSNWYNNPSPDAGWTGVTTTSCINSDPLFYSISQMNSDFLGLLTSSPCINTAEDGTNMGALFGGLTAWSDPVINFTKFVNNPVLVPSTPPATDAGYVSHACVRKAPDGTYKMWYTAAETLISYPRRIHLATSSDGINWTKQGYVLDQGASGTWDQYQVHMATVLWDPNTSLWKMWYVGHGSGSGAPNYYGWQEIGYATSPNGTTWTKYAGNPVFASPHDSNAFDSRTCRAPAVLIDNSDVPSKRYKMWYYGTSLDGQHYGPTGYATSPDGITWTRVAQINESDFAYVCPDVLQIKGNFYMFHNVGPYLQCSVSSDGIAWKDWPNDELLALGTTGEWDAQYQQAPTCVYDSNTDKLNMWYNGIKDYTEDIEKIGGAWTWFLVGQDTNPPTPNPATWVYGPYDSGNNAISMTATTAYDASGVEYYFDETSGNPGGSDSGWRATPGYTNGGLSAGRTYSYKVKSRDKSAQYNETAWSTELQCTLPPITLFQDGFESGNFTTGGWTTQNSNATISANAKYTGTYGTKLAKATWIQKSISTVGYNTIHVKYNRKTYGMSSSEWLYVEWSINGTTWNTLESTHITAWAAADFTCGTGANNNANFRIRFRTNAGTTSRYAYVDDVVITGAQ